MTSSRVALVSLHTSPLAVPGSGDAGGLNVYVVALGEALAELGVTVELITRRFSESQSLTQFTTRGLPVRFLEAGPPRVMLKEELPSIVGRFQSALSELPRFDVLHSHYWLSGLAALPVATMTHAPHIQSLHTVGALKNRELAPDDRPEPEARLNSERLLVTRSLATIASTTAERDAIVADYDADPRRVHVIEPGVDTTVFRPTVAGRISEAAPMQSPLAGGERPFILTLGRIQPLKGYDLAIRVVAALHPEARPLLVIAGSPTPGAEPYLEGLRGLAHELGIADTVVFAGSQTRAEAADLVRRASLLLLTSHSETYGLVALEAAASGTPVISSRASGMALSVADGVSGMLMPNRDPALWAAAIGRLLADPRELSRLSLSAEEYGRAHSWRKTAERTLALYNQVTSH